MLIQSFLKFLELENVFETKKKYDGVRSHVLNFYNSNNLGFFLREKLKKKNEIDGSPGEG